MASTAQPALEGRDASGRTLEEAYAEDLRRRRVRSAQFQQWLDRMGKLKRLNPAWLLVPIALPLGLLLGGLAAIPLLHRLGIADAEIIRWVAFTPRLHQVILVILALVLIAARQLRRRLLVQARLEGLEVRDPEEPAEPEPES